MTLALPPRTNIPRPTKKDPKDTPNRVFNKIDWDQINGTEGVCHTRGSESGLLRRMHIWCMGVYEV
jgi:hypothetical protein